MTTWMDIRGLSEYLTIKPKTLYEMTRRGDIPFYRVNRLLRFKKIEVDNWMESNKVEVGWSEVEPQQIEKVRTDVKKAVRDIVKKVIESAPEKKRKIRPGPGFRKEES